MLRIVSRLLRWSVLAVVGFALPTAQSAEGTGVPKLDVLLKPVTRSGAALRFDFGVTRRGTPMPALITPDDLDAFAKKKTRVLLVAGLDGSPETVRAALAAREWFAGAAGAEWLRGRFAISLLPVASPDRWLARLRDAADTPGGDASIGYPPPEPSYGSRENPEAQYLWRWIGMHAPDLVVVFGAADAPQWLVPDAGERLADLRKALQAEPLTNAGDLASQLVREQPAGIGSIPAVRIDGAADGGEVLKALLEAVIRIGGLEPSPARQELQRRARRTPLETAGQLARRYGHNLDSVQYIPALALVGRLWLGELTGDASHRADVERIVAPYRDGTKPALGENVGGSHIAGHLVFAELARITGDERYAALVRAAADLAFDEEGHPKEAMPHHLEMSDSVFMGTPILVEAGRLTGEAKYYDMALTHLRFMRPLVLRDDGLYRHSPLDEAAWGRGNGFPALGLAWSLTHLPEDHPGRGEMLDAFRSHVAALAPHQDVTGMWHQVIDHPESYRELTATSMIAFAMIRGVDNGWLDEKTYGPKIERALRAIQLRIAADGSLVDVCTGTGKQKSLRDYFDRTAILGPDPRGGAMALLVTCEMAAWTKRRDAAQPGND
ncbi:MAG: glycoside hydrolase family 88 protein [Planctomycetes bacterium]|nr:glycoside hydrolase family 88 protein [Planctomycetota bacterium]